MRKFNEDLEKIIETVGSKENFNFPFKETETLRVTNIDALNLSVRSSNGLRRKGVTNIGGIIDNWNYIKNWRGLGITSVNEIKRCFYNYLYSSLSTDETKQFWADFVRLNYGMEI